jgi:hypothetical protein
MNISLALASMTTMTVRQQTHCLFQSQDLSLERWKAWLAAEHNQLEAHSSE